MLVKKAQHTIISKQKLKGNTLIEVLMSLSILSLVFVLGMGLLQQITGIHSPVQRFRTQNILQQEMEKTGFLLIPLTEEIEVLGRRIQREISWIDPQRQLVHVRISCFWGEQEIAVRHRIINLNNRIASP